MKKKYINFIDRKKLRNKMHAELNRSLVALFKGENVEIKYLDEPVEEYSKLVDEEETILTIVSRYENTEKIREEDQRRDNAFYGARDVIRNFSRHFDENKRDIAAGLDVVFEDFKTAPHQPFPEESTAINTLLLRLDKHQDDINLLGLGDWISELRQANDNVRTLTADRESEAAARAHFNMKKVRNSIDEINSEIFVRLEAVAALEGVEAYQSLFDKINARITEYNNILAREKGRRDSKKIEN